MQHHSPAEAARPISRLPWLERADMSDSQAGLADAILNGPRRGGNLADEQGRMRGPFNALLHAPEVGMSAQELGAAIRFRSTLSDRVREAACLLVASSSGCDFERVAHRRIGLSIGLSESEADELEQLGVPSSFDGFESAAADFVLHMLHDPHLTDDQYRVFAEELDATTLVELAVLVGYYRMLADVMSAFGVPGDEP